MREKKEKIPGHGQISSRRWPLGETGGRLLSRAISCNAGEDIIGSWAAFLGGEEKGSAYDLSEDTQVRARIARERNRNPTTREWEKLKARQVQLLLLSFSL